MKDFQKIRVLLLERLKDFCKIFKLNDTSWIGARYGLLIITLIIFVFQGYFLFSGHGTIDFILATFISILIALIIGGILAVVIRIFRLIPIGYMWILFSSIILLILSFFNIVVLTGSLVVIASIIIVVSLFGASLYNVFTNKFKTAKIIKKGFIISGLIIGLLSLSIGFYWLNNESTTADISIGTFEAMPKVSSQISIEDPSKKGIYSVKELSYGSGKDLHRLEYSSDIDLLTETVDGTAFIENWSNSRKKYLGFGPENMPINGLIWYPDGEGSFPLVVMVHGNHDMTDYSDTGYDYLGELLASRGFIFVSIDENFLNLSMYDDMIFLNGLKDDYDARAWVILEHLKELHKWNETKGNILYGKIDTNNIAVMGHSKGGEASAIAAAFNKMKTYPDNGNVKFHYDYNIKSVVAIAPTDKMYKPMGKSIELRDVNYLTIHGSHDMDVISFFGSNQYDRVNFSKNGDWFKSAVYVYGANHGQFNRNWGKEDFIGLGNKLFKTSELITQKEQEKIAEVLITSFLESTLKDKKEYTKVFRNLGYAGNWLPKTKYINNYLDSKTKMISTYEEDIDLSTTTIAGGEQHGENLNLWKEKIVPLKWKEKDTSAVFIGWDNMKIKKDRYYSISIPSESLKINDESSLVFELSQGEEEKNIIKKDAEVDFTIKLIDEGGNEASMPLSNCSYLHPKLKGDIGKLTFFQALSSSEIVFQSFEFNLIDFRKVNLDFDPKTLSEIIFVFDKTTRGSIVLDDIGIRE